MDIKREVRAVIGGVLNGRIDRATGSVMFMGYNVLLRAAEITRKVRETGELEERLRALEEAEAMNGGGTAWHR